MAMARNMIEQLGLNVYAEGLDRLESGDAVAWIRYDLPARENPLAFTVRKICGDARMLVICVWENLGTKVIHQIMQVTGCNVDDVNYSLHDMVRDHFVELHRIAGEETLMAHCARQGEHIVDSLADVMQRLSRIFVEYEDMLPFSKAKETANAAPSLGRMGEPAKKLVKP